MKPIPWLPWSSLARGRSNINMEELLVEKLALANGLDVYFYDCSRKIAGDRWYVKLLARIPVETNKERFERLGGEPHLYDDFVEATGGIVNFELHKERNFVDEREKDQVFKAILSRLKEHALDYMAHEDFADKFLKREIQAFMERRNWYRDQS